MLVALLKATPALTEGSQRYHLCLAADQSVGVRWSGTLRAERDGSGDGRQYTIAVKATDAAGNEGSASVEVVVPHDQGKKKGKS